MFSEYLQLITEILSAKEYKKYKKEDKKINFEKFSVKEYKKILPLLKKIFKDLNKGKFARTVIFDYNSLGLEDTRLNSEDKKLIKILNDAGYEVTEESYKLGMGLKNNKTIIINDIIVSLKSKDIDKLNQAYEKTKKEEIKKQIEFVNNIDQISYHHTAPYRLAVTNKFKIVLTIESRKIASQSTKTGWSSCMRFDRGGGEYRQYVMSGIQEGVIIAWLVKTGDEKKLESPTARVLIKPLKAIKFDDNDPDEIIWAIDTVYGDAPSNSDFKNKVQKIFDKYSSKENGIFQLNTDNIYADNIRSTVSKIDINFGEIRTKEDFDKLSLKDKFAYISTISETYLERLDYSKEDNVKLYINYCLKVYNDIYNIYDGFIKLLKELSPKQISDLYDLNNSRFISFILSQDYLDKSIAYRLAKYKDTNKSLIEELTKRDLIPLILVKNKGYIYKGIPISDFLKIVESEIKDGREEGKLNNLLIKLFKTNKDYAKTKKFIINKVVSKLLESKKEKLHNLIIRYNDFNYYDSISKENIIKIIDLSEMEGGISLQLTCLQNLGFENIIKYMKNGKLSITRTMETIMGIANYNPRLDQFLIRCFKEVFNDNNKEEFVDEVGTNTKAVMSYDLVDLIFDYKVKKNPITVTRFTRGFFASIEMSIQEKVSLYNKYLKKEYSKHKRILKEFKEFIEKENRELYRAMFKEAPRAIKERQISESVKPE